MLYELLIDLVLFVQWMADDAMLDPWFGGVVRWTHVNGDTCLGEYVELVFGCWVVFSTIVVIGVSKWGIYFVGF